MAETISSVGAFKTAPASSGTTGTTTLAVSPTTVGNVLVFGATLGGLNATITGVSGGGVTTWTKLAGPITPSYNAGIVYLWMGTVTATGAQTITISGTVLTGTNRLSSREYSSTAGAATTWLQDGVGVAQDNPGTGSTTVQFATLVCGGPRRLYVGYATVGSTANTTGQTAGYTVDPDIGSNPFFWNPNVSGTQSPTCVQASANHSSGGSVLIHAMNLTQQPPVHRARIIRASAW